MKNLIIITLFLLPLSAMPQGKKPIDSFLGIKFGSTILQVKTAMQSRGSTFDKTNSQTDLLLFDNVKLGSRVPTVFGVRFINGKAYSAIFIFKPKPEARTIEYYDDLQKTITEVYGKGESTKTFKSPFKDGDGDELSALESGNADYSTFWYDDKENMIAMTINEELEISLIYKDAVLGSLADEKNKVKEKADF